MRPFLATLLLVIGLAATLCAQPAYLNYQGRLSDAAGAPLSNGTYTLEFSIYDAANGGSNVWGPFLFDGTTGNGHAPQTVVLQGRFNVILGAVDTTARPLQDAFGGTNRFVEIKVDGGAPIVPRQQFLSSPYAFRSFNAFHSDTADQAASATLAASATSATLVTDPNVARLNGNPQTFTGQNNFSGSVTANGKGVVVGEQNFRIVRGSVSNTPGGSTFHPPTTGESFQFQHLNTGFWRVTFDQPFLSVPAVTANVNQESAGCCIVYGVTTTNFSCGVLNSNNRIDYPFNFIAIGGR